MEYVMSLDGQFSRAAPGQEEARQPGLETIEVVKQRIGRAIRRRRRIMNLTLDQLARRCDASFQQIQKYESGVNTVSAAQLWRISQALDVQMTYFFESIGRA
jgi:predicted transcriptional regulator